MCQWNGMAKLQPRPRLLYWKISTRYVSISVLTLPLHCKCSKLLLNSRFPKYAQSENNSIGTTNSCACLAMQYPVPQEGTKIGSFSTKKRGYIGTVAVESQANRYNKKMKQKRQGL
ncbi:hypothetical protein VTI28DRAFT_6987 [Corynascus sepedonium]